MVGTQEGGDDGGAGRGSAGREGRGRNSVVVGSVMLWLARSTV